MTGRHDDQSATHYRTATVDGVGVFYREAGPSDAPVVVLLHGFPSSSRMFRDLIPRLSDAYHVIAPDYLGSGFSGHPVIPMSAGLSVRSGSGSTSSGYAGSPSTSWTSARPSGSGWSCGIPSG